MYTHSVLHVFVLILYAGDLCAVLLCTDTLYMCDIQVYKCTGKQYKCDCTQIYHCLCESVLCESGRDATVYNVLLCTRILCIGFTVYQRLVCTCTVYQGIVYRFLLCTSVWSAHVRCTRVLCTGFTVYQRLVCTCTVYQGIVYRFYRVQASGLHMYGVQGYCVQVLPCTSVWSAHVHGVRVRTRVQSILVVVLDTHVQMLTILLRPIAI